MNKQRITTENAPKAIGPYAQGVKIGNLVFTSGQLPIDVSTGNLITDDIKEATHHCLKNLDAILKEAGTSLDGVIKVVVFLKDLNDFADMNEVYATYFEKSFAARSCVQVAKLPMDAMIEIEAVAEI